VAAAAPPIPTGAATSQHHPSSSTSPTENRPYSLTDAADIIKSIDMVFAEASSSTITAAREVEEARRNARAASELAHRFMAPTGSSSSSPETKALLTEAFHSSISTTRTFDANGSAKTPLTAYRGAGGETAATAAGGAVSSTMNGRATAGAPSSSPASRSSGRSSSGHYSKGGSRGAAPSGSSSVSQHSSNNIHAAEDLVALSLELDRTKQSLESEQMMHDETRSSLAQSKAKNAQLQAQIERLLNDMETQREDSGRRTDLLEQEVATYRMRVNAAEEDAQLALDIAKDNSTSREQVEDVLGQALQEIEDLRKEVSEKNSLLAQQVQPRAPVAPPPPPTQPPKSKSSKHVRFASPLAIASGADEVEGGAAGSSSLATLTPPKARAMVATGRELLYRSLGSPSPIRAPHIVADYRSFASSVSERRQRFLDRLKHLNVDLASPATIPTIRRAQLSIAGVTPQIGPSSPSGNDAIAPLLGTVTTDFLRVGKNVANMLRASGKRMNLTGRWWSEDGDVADGGEDTGELESDIVNLETLTRHYCTSVEVSGML